MFTGLVEAVGSVHAAAARPFGLQLSVHVRWPQPAPAPATGIGDSIAVNGACLTVVEAPQVEDARELLTFELSHETLARTVLGDLRSGDPINLERALRWGDRLGGHLVTGHVDAVGLLRSATERAGCWDLAYDLPVALRGDVVGKGSIAIDGISLTVNAVTATGVLVTIIPHTVAHTQILYGAAGRSVHIETDLVGKHVRRLADLYLRPDGAGGVSWDLLERSGFLQP